MGAIRAIERNTMSQQALADSIDAVTSQLTAANARLDKVAVEVATLRDLLAAAGDSVSPELQAAVDRIAAAAGATAVKVGAVDDLNPDS